MPGPAHETLVALLSQRPDLLDLLLRTLGRVGLPDDVAAADSTLRIANPLEVRPDLVLVAEGERGPWVVVEVQLGRDDDKQRRWLSAAGVLLDTRGAMGDVIVLTHDASVAAWAREVARVAGPGGTRLWLEPVVLQLTRVEAERLLATGNPELALLAAWAVHDQRGRDAQEVVRAVVEVIEAAPDAQLRQVLVQAMISMLGDPLVAVVREMLMNPIVIPPSPAYLALRREIEAIGEARGEAIGKARGEAIGEVRGEANALVVMLEARGFSVADADRERITGCDDVALLRRWITRAVRATALDEVFVEHDDAA